MPTHIEVLFTPADFALVSQRDLSKTTCVVFDILRATSSIVTALANGAEAILPVETIEEALAWRKNDRTILLAGERDGLRIGAALTGGTEFDLGNSPREFADSRIRGHGIVMTTTNGTRALRACAKAQTVLVASFLNLDATAAMLRKDLPGELVVVCSGTFEEAALEDVLGAGALCELMVTGASQTVSTSDSVLMARRLFQQAKDNLLAAISQSRNGRRLLSRPVLGEDVAFCAQMNVFDRAVGMYGDGWVRTAP